MERVAIDAEVCSNETPDFHCIILEPGSPLQRQGEDSHYPQGPPCVFFTPPHMYNRMHIKLKEGGSFLWEPKH